MLETASNDDLFAKLHQHIPRFRRSKTEQKWEGRKSSRFFRFPAEENLSPESSKKERKLCNESFWVWSFTIFGCVTKEKNHSKRILNFLSPSRLFLVTFIVFSSFFSFCVFRQHSLKEENLIFSSLTSLLGPSTRCDESHFVAHKLGNVFLIHLLLNEN